MDYNIKLLFQILIGFVFANMAICSVLYFVSRQKEYLRIIIYWAMVSFVFIVQGLFQEHPIQIALAITVTVIPIFYVTWIVLSVINRKLSIKLYGGLILSGLTTTILLYKLNFSFKIFAMPLSLAIAGPFFEGTYWILFKERKRSTKIQKFLAGVMVLSIIHCVNFALFRMEDGAQIWGWMVSFLLYQIFSVLLPAFVVEKLSNIEKQKINVALYESQKMLNLVMDNIPQSIFWKDTKSVYLGCNKKFAKEAGIESVEDVIGKTDYDLAWSKEESDFFRKCDSRVMESKKPEYHIIEPQRQADGKQAWLDTNKIPLCNMEGMVIGILGTYEDITERKEAEDMLENYKILISNTSDLAYICDAKENILYLNDAFEELSGHKPEEFIGKPFAPLFDEENLKKAMDLYTKTMEGNKLKRELTFKDTQIICEYNTNPLRDKQGRVIGVIGIARNMTERKRMEEELIKLNTKLKDQDKLKTEFLSTVSHEIRTPLALILGFASIVIKRFNNIIIPNLNVVGSKVKESLTKTQDGLGVIISEGQRLSLLIDDLLDIAKIESGDVEWEMEEVSLVDIVERAIKVTSIVFEESGLEMIKDFENELPSVEADKSRLEQVMINLISNAIKFTNKGTIICRISRQDSEIVASVIDTGIGIEEGGQKKIFEKFGQVAKTEDGKPKGTGLGLSICKQIIERHDGRIWVESKPGKGSNFSFSIPCKSG